MCGSRFLWLFVLVFFLANSTTTDVRGETASRGRQRLQTALQTSHCASFRLCVLSGSGSNPRRRSSSHSEASRLNSRQISKRQRGWRIKGSGRLRLEAFSSMSALRFRSERRRRWASVAARVLRGFGTRVEALVGVKLIALQDIVGSELHEGGERQFRRA